MLLVSDFTRTRGRLTEGREKKRKTPQWTPLVLIFQLSPHNLFCHTNLSTFGRLKEAQNINKSLSGLGDVIAPSSF